MSQTLMTERWRGWGQTRGECVPDPEAAAALLNRVGVATHFPASPEIPNLYQAHMGDPEAKTQPQWDSPSGRVYTWRWEMGQAQAGFYCVLVRKRPTWVSWALLPAVLRLRGEMRTPDELMDLAVISSGAYRIAQALEASGGLLSTADLRRAAGFPTGKEQRAAYLKAVEELDSRLMLAKVFQANADDMSHALVMLRYPHHAEEAERMTPEEAYDRFLRTYLPNAVFAAPVPLARHLGVPEAELRAALDRLVEEGAARRDSVEGYKGECYIWIGGTQ